MHSTQPLPSAAQLRGSRHRPPAPPPRPSAPPRCRLLASCSATAAPAPTAISCSELFLTLGSGASAVQALRGVSLSVPAGTLHMLLGRNGCGKSSLLRCCAGLVQPQAGLLTVGVPRGYVFQNPDHQVVMPSAGADVAFGLARLGLSDEEVRTRVEAALEAVGLKGFGLRPVHTLSGGQKQRVAIAGVLAEQPQVLLLDELTTFLDPGDQAAVLRAVRAAVGGPRNVTALWVTHRIEELDQADGATLMDAGRVVCSASGKEMRKYLEREWKLSKRPV